MTIFLSSWTSLFNLEGRVSTITIVCSRPVHLPVFSSGTCLRIGATWTLSSTVAFLLVVLLSPVSSAVARLTLLPPALSLLHPFPLEIGRAHV